MKHNKSDELKMLQVHKNNDEGQSRSLVFKIFRTSPHSSSENSAAILPSEDRNNLLSFDYEISRTEDSAIKKEDTPESLLKDEMSHSVTVIKEETEHHEPRRSARLLALQSKLDLNRNSEYKLQGISYEYTQKKKDSVPGAGKKRTRTKKVKNEKSSNCTSTSKCIKNEASMDSQEVIMQCISPSKMRLNSMLLMPTLRKSSPSSDGSLAIEQDGIYPKFANVDPSPILSSFVDEGNIARKLRSQKAISLFFPHNENTRKIIKPVRNYKSFEENSLYQYKFKKTKLDLSYLSKKYHMLDSTTLDNCYGLSNYSLRKTEIMLSDIISGKEVAFSRSDNEECFNCNCEECSNWYSSGNYINDLNSDYDLPFTFRKSNNHQNSENRLIDYNLLLSSDIISQSIKIMYNEEAVLC